MTLLSYRDVHNVVAHTPIVVRNVRHRRELSYREAADEIGISHSTLWRFEQGRDHVDAGTVLRILAWLDAQASARASAAVTSTIDAPAGHLRSTVKATLTPETGLAGGRIAAGVGVFDDVDVPGRVRPMHAHPGQTDGHAHPGGGEPHAHIWDHRSERLERG